MAQKYALTDYPVQRTPMFPLWVGTETYLRRPKIHLFLNQEDCYANEKPVRIVSGDEALWRSSDLQQIARINRLLVTAWHMTEE